MKRKESMRIGLVVVLALLVASSAQAAVYFSEDFDNMAVNSSLTSATGTTNGGSWTVSTGGSTSNTLKAVADPGGRSGNSIYFTDWSSSAVALMQANLTQAVSGPVKIKYDYYYASPSPSYAYVTLFAHNTSGQRMLYTNAYSVMNTTTSTLISYDPSYAGTATGYIMPNGQWYTVEMVLPDLSAGGNFTYGLKVTNQAGTVVYNNDSVPSFGAGTGLKSVQFTTISTYAKFYLDNISVSDVPEPATMMLTGIGGVFCIFRRKR